MSLSCRLATAAAFLALATGGASAQQRSQSYTFLEAVRSEDGTKVTEILNAPGQQIINTRDSGTGEGALHIVAKRGDLTYLTFLLSKGANPNLQDRAGNTAALYAVERGMVGGIDVLKRAHADFNLANASGETPLIRAVQLRNLDMVRALLAAGADPDRADVMAGMSARDYARRDSRSPALLREIEAAPKADKRDVAGPR